MKHVNIYSKRNIKLKRQITMYRERLNTWKVLVTAVKFVSFCLQQKYKGLIDTDLISHTAVLS